VRNAPNGRILYCVSPIELCALIYLLYWGEKEKSNSLRQRVISFRTVSRQAEMVLVAENSQITRVVFLDGMIRSYRLAR
jgi:hypothetical protein